VSALLLRATAQATGCGNSSVHTGDAQLASHLNTSLIMHSCSCPFRPARWLQLTTQQYASGASTSPAALITSLRLLALLVVTEQAAGLYRHMAAGCMVR